MNPIDVVRTRYYNQTYKNGQGALYSSGVDAVGKIMANEGPSAFYKGFFPHFLRIGPHFCCIISLTTVTFVFLGMMKRGVQDWYAGMDQKDFLKAYDTDRNGCLDHDEMVRAMKAIFGASDTETVSFT